MHAFFILLPTCHDIFTINSLRPSDAIWRQRSGSTSDQVMAWCLMAPNHYLNQCWLIISKAEWHSSKGKFTRDTSVINRLNYLENEVPKISFKFPRGHWVKKLTIMSPRPLWVINRERCRGIVIATTLSPPPCLRLFLDPSFGALAIAAELQAAKVGNV